MGEIVGAGIVSHVPTIMLPEATRRELNGGEDTTLVAGLRRLRREVFEKADYDTVVLMDSHWATTVEFVVTTHDRRSGLFTSEELPRGMCRIPYDIPGDPELARAIAGHADQHGTWITPIDDHHLPIFYATTNLWNYLGVEGKRWISIGVCQTADTEDYLRLGRAIADGIAATDRKVLFVASGALSHTFWPLREIRDHEASNPGHIFTPQARAADEQRIAWFEAGRHDLVLRTMPEFLTYKPEARFGHYLAMAGALGEEHLSAPGRLFSAYENAVGTGQVHIWFDRPAGGWTAPRAGAGPHHHPHHDQETHHG
ncbi:catechol 1,2-dioxygenase [Streptomyces sp. ISL-44]|uniref:DODA-type extradiol aromatic ring-opening family dioxygenase n=1 Tax=Streptomyces sp. ISL-44 TaxID=2819184 RepID=UPI001BE8DDC5|nr:catechol 1,2-dioxygenase [Streptomyces sp. ISL-44]MBT2542679.1 catechol 1,2-dioxygenase [Streptomyces sp. ISL-44]